MTQGEKRSAKSRLWESLQDKQPRGSGWRGTERQSEYPVSAKCTLFNTAFSRRGEKDNCEHWLDIDDIKVNIYA